MAQLATQMTGYVMIFTVALNSMAARFITIEINQNNNEQANLYFNSVLRANTVIAVILMVPAVLVSVYVDRIFHVPHDIIADVRWTFGFVFINTILILLGNIFTIATFVKNKLYLSSARSIEGNIIKIVLAFSLYGLLVPRVYYITLSFIFMSVYILFTNIHYTKKLLPEVKVSAKTYSGQAVFTLLRSGIWNALDQLSNVLLGSLDLWIANVLLGATLMGQYSLAKSMPLFLLLFIASVSSVFAPQFTILYAQEKKQELLAAADVSLKIMTVFVTVPVAFLFVFGDAFFRLWLPGEETPLLYALSNIILVPIVLSGNLQPLLNIFTVTDRLKAPAFSILIAGILNIVLTFILYYRTSLGIFSIPIASLIVRALKDLSFLPFYAAICLKQKWFVFFPAIFRNAFCFIMITVICYAFKNFFAVDSWLRFLIALVVCGIGSLIICVALLLGKKELAHLRLLISAHK